MNKKLPVLLVGVLWLALTLAVWFSPAKAASEAERRPLEQLPRLSAETLLDGSFMEKFDAYSLDQFPLRDRFRTLKSLFATYLMGQRDNNGIYIADGYAAKLEYPLDSISLSNALKKFNALYTRYLEGTDCKPYLAIVPDKGRYLAKPNGYPALDYDALFARMEAGMPWAAPIDLTDTLSLESYYFTDTHWRQERLQPTAQKLDSALGVPAPGEFTQTLATERFYGVYYGQAALPIRPEALYIMESPALQDCRVYNPVTETYGSIYDLPKLSGQDPYDVYLSGAHGLLTVENPNAATHRELIIFRDSFGSSLAPLLVPSYSRVTLVDIRYMASSILGNYLTFENQDVLFLYSTLILNSSDALK